MVFLFLCSSPSTGFTQATRAIDPIILPQELSDCKKVDGRYNYPCSKLATMVVKVRIVRDALEGLALRNRHLSDMISDIKTKCPECKEYYDIEGLSQKSIDLSNAIRDIKPKFSL